MPDIDSPRRRPMTSSLAQRLPQSTLHWLGRVPIGRPVAMLIRHSKRPELPPGDAAYHVPITEEGEQLAIELGRLIGERLRSLYASPLKRTMQTGEKLGVGAGLVTPVKACRRLGDPGVYVVDDKRAEAEWLARGHEVMMYHLVRQGPCLPGLAEAGPAARLLVRHMLETADGITGIHAFVTHDSLVTATAAQMLAIPLGAADWPQCLEAAFFWHEGAGIRTAYREWDARHPGPPDFRR